jgi:hypothetical protein
MATPSAPTLAGYTEASEPPPPSRQIPGGKWLGLAAAAVIVWAVIAMLTDTKHPARPPKPVEPTPSPSPRAPLGTGAVEVVLADRPTEPSYQPDHGALFKAVRGYFEPVDAAITRNQPGDYTIAVPNLADLDLQIQVSSYDSASICYNAGSEAVGREEVVRVLCERFVPNVFPVFTTRTDSRFTIALIHP